MEEDNWIEINSEKDLPDENQYCWFINRTNGYIFISKLKGQMGRSLSHLTFSHYIPITLKTPNPPKYQKPLDKTTSWREFDVKEILKDKKII